SVSPGRTYSEGPALAAGESFRKGFGFPSSHTGKSRSTAIQITTTLLWCRAWRRFHQEQFKLKHTRISAFITVSPEDPLLSHADEGITTRLVIMDVFQFIPCFG
ncbi:hypothetical protein AcV7_008704, partial [Taiwanofungus camphoratus]